MYKPKYQLYTSGLQLLGLGMSYDPMSTAMPKVLIARKNAWRK